MLVWATPSGSLDGTRNFQISCQVSQIIRVELWRGAEQDWTKHQAQNEAGPRSGTLMNYPPEDVWCGVNLWTCATVRQAQTAPQARQSVRFHGKKSCLFACVLSLLSLLSCKPLFNCQWHHWTKMIILSARLQVEKQDVCLVMLLASWISYWCCLTYL